MQLPFHVSFLISSLSIPFSRVSISSCFKDTNLDVRSKNSKSPNLFFISSIQLFHYRDANPPFFSWFSDFGLPNCEPIFHNDSWFQASIVLTTGMNSVFVLGYFGTIMVPLGWIGAISLHANMLVAELLEHGGKRHIRYRDLAAHIYGRRAYSITWAMQYVNLFMINIAYLIFGGSALKACYFLFRGHHTMKLPYFIAIDGFVCILFAISAPHLSSQRIWLGCSTVLRLIYIIVACVLATKDGINTPSRDYSIHRTSNNGIFTTIGASANLVFAFNTGMLPEVEATVRQPAVKNMLKALCFKFTVGVPPMYAVTFIGYWAYGASTSTYLLNSIIGQVWVKVAFNISAFLQSVIALHIFASPTYEYLDTKFGIRGSALKFSNLSFRIMARGGYLAISTLVSALLPFLGDFKSLTGALSTFPLTFILANHMYLKVEKNKLSSLQKSWYWLNIAFFGLMSIAATVAAIKLIQVDSKEYHLFADV